MELYRYHFLAFFIRALVFLSFICALTEANNSKCPYAKFTPFHTLCQFKGPNKACDITDRGLSVHEINSIVQQHNVIRSLVSIGGTRLPTASNMKMMHWDRELAAIAQRWSEQCRPRHDCNRCRQVDRFLVGQNIFIEEFDDNDLYNPNWMMVVGKWYDQIKKLNASSVESYQFSEENGDLTQLIWAESTLIGCGYTEYRMENKNRRMYICNYGPAGNILLDSVYKEGDACSFCNGTCSAKFLGLCNLNGAKSSRSLQINKKVKEGIVLGSCHIGNKDTKCFISNIGEVKWEKMDGMHKGEIAQGAYIFNGMSTDFIVQMETKQSKHMQLCVSFWYKKYPSSNNPRFRNRDAKIYIVTSDDDINKIILNDDSLQWRKVSKTIKQKKYNKTITVMVHFDLKNYDQRKLSRYGRKSDAHDYVTLMIYEVIVKAGTCKN